MSRDPHDVIQVYSGPLVVVEQYQQVLREAGIESRVVGTDLTASFGTALPGSIELWIHRGDLDAAKAAIKLYEDQRERKGGEHQHFPHPSNAPKPGSAPPRKEPHVKQDPMGE